MRRVNIQQIIDIKTYLPNFNLDLFIQKLSPYFKESLTFFDVETSGLSPMINEIIEFGAIKIDFQTGKVSKFESLLKNSSPLSSKNISIHGITNEDLENAPEQLKIVNEFFEFIKDSSLVAYNAQFDLGFLITEIWKYKLNPSLEKVIDALYMARASYKTVENRPENYRLDSFKSFYNLELNSHRAFDDSLVCLEVFYQCMEILKWDARSISRFIIYNFKKPGTTENFLNDDSEKIKLIKKAISDGKSININYKGGSKGSTPRPIQPIALLPMPNCVNLYARCLKDEQFKLFNTKRIKKVQDV